MKETNIDTKYQIQYANNCEGMWEIPTPEYFGKAIFDTLEGALKKVKKYKKKNKDVELRICREISFIYEDI